MEITWYGHACFEITTSTTTIVTDPYDKSLGLSLPQLQADIVTVSHNNPRHNAIHLIEGNTRQLNRPGEYEINQVFIIGDALYPPTTKTKQTADDRNIVFIYEFDGLTLCHMGDIRHVPTQSQVESFVNVDILLVPVGDGKSLSAAQASEIIGLIEPAIVVPMHYYLPNITIPLDPLDKFLKEMGLPATEPLPKLKLSQGNLPAETQTIVLAPQNER